MRPSETAGEATLDRLSLLVLGRLSARKTLKKAPSQRDVTADVGKFAGRSGTAGEWEARIGAVLDQLAAAGLIQRKPLRLTPAGIEALRRGFGRDRPPTWDELPGLLATRMLGLEPGSTAARHAVESTESLSAAILARRFGVAEERRLGRVIDALAARALGVPSENINIERLRARVLARRLGLPDRDTMADVVDSIIAEKLGLPPGRVDWQRLRKTLLARSVGTTLTGEPTEVAKRVAAQTMRIPKAEKRAILAALTQRWVDNQPIATEEPGARPAEPPRNDARAEPPKAEPPRAEAPAAAPDTTAFHDRVREAAAEIEGDGRFGDRRVFVAALWRRLTQPDQPLVGMTLDDFKRRLLDANRDGTLSLVRADLVDAMEPTAVAESEIRDLGSSFHFVLDDSRS